MTIDDLKRVDTRDMYAHLTGFPAQWRAGREGALTADLERVRPTERPVLVAGMGGSAIGGDLLRTMVQGEAGVPVLVSRSYTLPAWVGPGVTVVVSSYSGTTEETLAALREALRRGASPVCITSGGTVADLAEEHRLPMVRIPGGKPPRAALGYSLTALLTIAERLGLLAVEEQAWQETLALLEAQTRVLSDPAANEALDLARALHGLFPFVYSAEGFLEAVNVRWRNQFHENSKTLATGNLLPELDHNEIMGWEWEAGDTGRIGVVVLRDAGDHPKVQRRIDVTRTLIESRAGCWHEVYSRGDSPLCRLLSLVNLGDWVSYYLALLNGVDPTPIGLISRLKEALK